MNTDPILNKKSYRVVRHDLEKSTYTTSRDMPTTFHFTGQREQAKLGLYMVVRNEAPFELEIDIEMERDDEYDHD